MSPTVAPLSHFYAVIPAGGIGSRLWPLSRAEAPKFLHDLAGTGSSLLRATWERLSPLAGEERIMVVTGRAHRSAVARASAGAHRTAGAHHVLAPTLRNRAPFLCAHHSLAPTVLVASTIPLVLPFRWCPPLRRCPPSRGSAGRSRPPFRQSPFGPSSPTPPPPRTAVCAPARPFFPLFFLPHVFAVALSASWPLDRAPALPHCPARRAD